MKEEHAGAEGSSCEIDTQSRKLSVVYCARCIVQIDIGNGCQTDI